MNKLVLKNELKRNKKSLIIWSIVSILAALLFMAIFPFIERLMQKMIESMKPMYESMGVEVPDDFGMNTSAVSYFASEVGSFYQLASMLFAALIGFGVWSKEESNKTAEFLLTSPVRRDSVWKSKLLSAVTIIGIYGAIFSLFGFFIVLVVSNFSTIGIVWADMLGLVIMLVVTNIVQVLITLFCFAVSFFFKKTPSVGMAFVVVFGMMILQLIIGVMGSAVETEIGKDIIHALYYISPFSIISPSALIGLTQGVYQTALSDLWYICGSLVIWLALTATLLYYSYNKFLKRDIPN